MQFQSLESRRHFSVTHSLDAAGTLTVQGDFAHDVITIDVIASSVMVNPQRFFAYWPPRGGYPLDAVKHIVVRGGWGDDQITVNTPVPATIAGDDGNDTVSGGSGDDHIDGGPGHDTLSGRSGNDTLAGGAGFGFDSLSGDDGDDTLLTDPARDRYAGGAGRDHLTYAGRTATILVTPGGGFESGDYFAGEGDNVAADIEVFTLGSGDDYFYGYVGDVTVFAGPGNDWVDAWDGNDALFGEDGNDSLNGMGGDDFLVGGRGNDNLYGEAGHDFLLGSEGIDVFYGGDGNDRIDARDGNREFVDGGDGYDVAWIDRLFWWGFQHEDVVGVEAIY